MDNNKFLSSLESAFIEESDLKKFYSRFTESLKKLLSNYQFDFSIVFTSPHNPTFHWQPVHRSRMQSQMKAITAESYKSLSQSHMDELLRTNEIIYLPDEKSLLEKEDNLFFNRLKEMSLSSFLFIPLISHDDHPIGWIAFWTPIGEAPMRFPQEIVTNLTSLLQSSRMRNIFMKLRTDEIYRDLAKNYKQLVESSDDLVIIRSKSGLILQINDFVEKKLGYKKSDFIGKHIDEIVINGHRVFLDEYILDDKEIDNLIKNPGTKTRIASIFDYDGNMHLIEGTISQYDLYEFPAIQIRAKDVTQIKKLEADLQNSQRFEALTTLARGIAHDVNNLLQAISGNVTLLRTFMEEESSVDVIYNILAELESTINNSEKFSKRLTNLSSEESVIDKTPIEVISLVTDISRFYLAGSSIELLIKGHNSQQMWTLGDAHSVTQIVSNLLLNARDALKEIKKPRILINFENLGEKILVTIKDNGKGIPEELQSKILLPYFTTKSHGSGLGLSTAFARIKAMHGNLRFTSLPGNTTFVLEFPAIDPKEFSISIFDEGKSQRQLALSENSINLLIVDDESILLKSLETFLRAFEIYTFSTTTHSEAIKIFKENPKINCVLIDFHLKPGNGLDLLEEMKKIRKVKSIIYTGSPSSIDYTTMNVKPNRIIAKPILLDDLLFQIQSIMKYAD